MEATSSYFSCGVLNVGSSPCCIQRPKRCSCRSGCTALTVLRSLVWPLSWSQGKENIIIIIVICTLRVKFLRGQHVRTQSHDLLVEPRLLDFEFISLGNEKNELCSVFMCTVAPRYNESHYSGDPVITNKI